MKEGGDMHEDWLDRPQTAKNIFIALIVLCVALVVADLFVHKHGHFHFEEWIGFHAVFGFMAYCAIVLSAKQIRRFIKREENYYDE